MGRGVSAAGETMPSVTSKATIRNQAGLHARPAMAFVDIANKFESRVTVFKAGDEPVTADGKSVLEMIGLLAPEGTLLSIEADGADAESAVAALTELIESKFGED
jgi:phosphocarrier protein